MFSLYALLKHSVMLSTYVFISSARCESTMNHTNSSHITRTPCRYQHQFDNNIFICKVSSDLNETNHLLQTLFLRGGGVGVETYLCSCHLFFPPYLVATMCTRFAL